MSAARNTEGSAIVDLDVDIAEPVWSLPVVGADGRGGKCGWIKRRCRGHQSSWWLDARKRYSKIARFGSQKSGVTVLQPRRVGVNFLGQRYALLVAAEVPPADSARGIAILG
jgi:hypothetical protein